MNRIQLTGVLTKPPVVRETADGKKLCTICIAVNRNYANATGVFEDDYFHCVAWGGLADVVSKVFSTGSRIALSGSMQTRKREKNGVEYLFYEVRIDFVENLGSIKKTSMLEVQENWGKEVPEDEV